MHRSSSWISRVLSRGITLCIYVILLSYYLFLSFFVISFSLYIPVPFFSDSYYSSHIFFPSLRKRWKNTSKGGNNSFLASWNSFNHFCRSRRSRLLHFITRNDATAKVRFKGTILHANNNDTVLSRENITFLIGMESKLSEYLCKKISQIYFNTFVEIYSRCIEIYRKNLFLVAFIEHVSSVHSRAFRWTKIFESSLQNRRGP